MSRATYQCKYPGCTAKTIYDDRLCRVHRRTQSFGDANNVTKIHDALKSPSNSGWAMSAIAEGRKIIENKPTPIYSQVNGVDAFAVTKYIKRTESDQDIRQVQELAEAMGGTLGNDGEYYSFAAPVVATPSPLDIARERYCSYTFPNLGANAHGVEQYDDVAEAISSLNISKRFREESTMSYMVGADAERIRLKEGDVTIIARIVPKSKMSISNEGVIYQEYDAGIESYKQGYQDMPIEDAQRSQPVRDILLSVCHLRETIEAYKIQTPHHEGTSEFFIPVGWTDIPRFES